MIGKSLTDARSTYQEQMAEYVTEITDLLEGFRVINQMTVGKILDKHEHVLNETAEKRYQYGKKKSMVLGVSELTLPRLVMYLLSSNQLTLSSIISQQYSP